MPISKQEYRRRRSIRIALILGLGAMVILVLLQVDDIKNIIRTATQQVWFYLIMLFMKLGDETIWRPIELEIEQEKARENIHVQS